MLDGTVKSIEEIAERERCSLRKVNMTLSLAFLAPDLVKAAIAACLPRGVGISRLCDLPASWSEQFQRLGIAPPQWISGEIADSLRLTALQRSSKVGLPRL
jgi:hypothetical protein